MFQDKPLGNALEYFAETTAGETVSATASDEIISHYVRDTSSMIPIMQDIQAEYHHLPAICLRYTAKGTEITAVKTYSVAAFCKNIFLSGGLRSCPLPESLSPMTPGALFRRDGILLQRLP